MAEPAAAQNENGMQRHLYCSESFCLTKNGNFKKKKWLTDLFLSYIMNMVHHEMMLLLRAKVKRCDRLNWGEQEALSFRQPISCAVATILQQAISIASDHKSKEISA